MLHILWMILKFILIVLGILLGILFLALFLVLFCPVRYRAQVSKDSPDWKAVEGEAGVSWLYRGISFKVYRRAGENGFSVRILGIPVDKILRKRKEKKEKMPREPEGYVTESAGEAEKETKLRDEADVHGESPEENFPELSNNSAEVPSGPEEEEHTPPRKESEPKQKKSGFFDRIGDKLSEIRFKILAIGLTIRKIRGKIDWWKSFIHHPKTQEALSLVWKHAKYLIRHILPTKVEGNVVFGSENPAVTGQVLAVLGMSFPLHKNCIAVTPRFDGENIAEGKIKLKGRIYGIVLVRAAVTVYFNKNVKYVIKRVKHRSHKEG